MFTFNKTQRTMAQRRCYLWASIFFNMCLDPLRDRNSFLQLLSFPFFLYFIFAARGCDALTDQIVNTVIAAKAIFWAIPAFVVWNAVAAVFKVKDREAALGILDSNVFVYHQPLHVFTKRVVVEDNNKPFVFRVDDPPANTFITWEIDIEKAAEDRVQALVDFKHGKNASQSLSWGNHFKPGLTGGIRLPKDKLLSLVVCLKPETIPIVARVYITSFEIQNV